MGEQRGLMCPWTLMSTLCEVEKHHALLSVPEKHEPRERQHAGEWKVTLGSDLQTKD